ncbi:MAG: hypothetical protein E6J91_03310 [Deltaproteobacteria bacterium]|nr:MAG: hypothetical protein E6J91_03310 [Deltaproteobacteria bacterium]
MGRNDPCPCGSGKKFKKCHGLERPAGLTHWPTKPTTHHGRVLTKALNCPRISVTALQRCSSV